MKDIIEKLIARISVPLIILLGLVVSGVIEHNFLKILCHKLGMILIGYVVAELIWQIGYKRFFGELEGEHGDSKYRMIAFSLFRGMLYFAIIYGLVTGI